MARWKDLIRDILTDAGGDALKMLPFLFAAFLAIEALEHYSTDFTEKFLVKVGKAGPIAGALAGCIPQCGFSVMAANLYAGGVISVGTLLSVFIATSDEAVLIIMGNPGQGGKVLELLCVKVALAVSAGYASDIFLRKYISEEKKSGVLCAHCGCHEHNARILKPALNHTMKIFAYLFLFTAALDLCIEAVGVERLSGYLLGDTWFQPAVTALVGLIPNCAASVMLTQAYLSGAISFASVIAGLCAGAGVGLAVLFKVNKSRRENLKILGTLYLISVLSGILLKAAGIQ